MKQFFILCTVQFLCIAVLTEVHAQTDSIKWPLSANQTFTTYGSLVGVNQSFRNLAATAYSGFETSQKSADPTTLTLNAGYSDTVYHQYVVSPVAGQTFHIDSLSFKVGSATGNLRVAMYYALDSNFTNPVAVIASSDPISPKKNQLNFYQYPVNLTVNSGQAFYLRLYPYLSAASATKPLQAKDVVIKGTAILPNVVPTVITKGVYNITPVSAVGGGNITQVGGGDVTERGICWSTSPNPVITDAHTSDGTGSGSFTSNITGLTKGVTYHVRAYATNNVGTGYGGDSTFTTLLDYTPPTVITSGISNIYTVSAKGGGNVTFDGGSPVIGRGICWSTAANPTLTDSHTSDSSGLGNFVSMVSGLNPATVYHVRAYATNGTGTNYGGDSTFSTLPLSAPSVSTASASFISLTSASCGGNVTFDGGLPITVRGICYNTTGNPTLGDKVTIDGAGLGIFGSRLTGLSSGSTYYVKAYAVNSLGTSFGEQVTFTTQTPGSTITVAKDGSGDFTTISDAFKAIPKNATTITTVYIKKGVYFEKDTLVGPISNVIIRGEDKDSTIIQYDDYSGRVVGSVTLGTSTSQTLWIQSNVTDLTIENLTIENTSTAAQAVALNVQGDRIFLNNCKLLGYQDTYYTWGVGRLYHKNCFIAGTVDFIFGSSIAVFDSCELHERRNSGTLTAASTPIAFKYGYLFRDCIISYDATGYDGTAITNILLGRPWNNAPRTVFIHCYEPAILNAAGWQVWNVTPGLYAEYNCYGPGSTNTSQRIISKQLTASEAADFTTANVFAKGSGNYSMDWYPETGTGSPVSVGKSSQVIPTRYKLHNYPNPFNPSTTITYQLPVAGKVTLRVFDITGREVMTLVDEVKPAGEYNVRFDAGNLSSGVYFTQLRAGGTVLSNKIVFLK